MGIEYYASFAPVPLSRQKLVFPLNVLLSEVGARLDQECAHLELAGGQFEYSPGVEFCESVEDAIRISSHWGGVEIHFGWLGRSCSVLLWNDVPGRTTVVFSEPGVLFEQHVQDPASLTSLVGVLLRFVDLLGAGFCVFEPGSTFRSRHRQEILDWLTDVQKGKPSDWAMVIVSAREIPEDAVTETVRRKLFFKLIPERGVWILSTIGTVEWKEKKAD